MTSSYHLPDGELRIEAVREMFPVAEQYNYLNHAGVAPLCKPAADAIAWATANYRDRGNVGWDVWDHVRQARRTAAGLINAGEDEVTFIKNTTEGLSLVANGMTWARGDNIVTTSVEFPANVYPWMQLQSRGVQLRQVDPVDGRIEPGRLAEAIDSHTRLVTISTVQFGNGFRCDLEAIGSLCRDAGVLLCVDAIQSLGVIPMDVRRYNIDFLSADGHKWLLGPEGAGVFYCRRELLTSLTPTTVGWMAMTGGMNFDEYHFELRRDARRFDSGAYNVVGVLGLAAAIEFLTSLGIEKVFNHVLRITDMMIERLEAIGWEITSPRHEGDRSGIVTFRRDDVDLHRLYSHLLDEHHIVTAVRRGGLRVSPHCYTNEAQVDHLMGILERVET